MSVEKRLGPFWEGIGLRPKESDALNANLEIQAPKFSGHFLKFEAELPSGTSLVTSPNEQRVARTLVRQIDQPQPLPHGKTLRENCQTAFGANIERIAFRAQFPACLAPLHGNSHPG